MGLADDRGETSSDAAQKYDSYHFKSERQAILDAVSKLISGESRPDHHQTDSPSADQHLN